MTLARTSKEYSVQQLAVMLPPIIWEFLIDQVTLINE